MGRNEMPDRAVFLVWNIRKSADFELSFIMWLWNATGNMFSSLNKLKSIESNESIFILRMLKTCKSACVILWVSEAKISWVGFFFSCHQESSFIEHLWLFIMDIWFYRCIFSSSSVVFRRMLMEAASIKIRKHLVHTETKATQLPRASPNYYLWKIRRIVFDSRAKNI